MHHVVGHTAHAIHTGRPQSRHALLNSSIALITSSATTIGVCIYLGLLFSVFSIKKKDGVQKPKIDKDPMATPGVEVR